MSEVFYSLEGPLDALPGDRQTRAANLSGFPDLARRLGGDPRRILERHGIDPRIAKDPESFIDCQAVVDTFEYCGSALNDRLFGLRLALQQEPDIFGCVTALARSAPTVSEGLRQLIEYLPIVHSPECMLEVVEGQDVAELRWGVRADLGLNEQAHYQTLGLFMKVLQMLGGPRFSPTYVSLALEVRPQDLADIEAQVGCRVRSRAASHAIAFPRHVLNQSVGTQNRLLFRLVDGYLSRVKGAARTTIVERVQDYVRGALPSGSCSIERCAEKLGVSVRTLQARLSRNDLRFSDVLERQRIELAKEYLKQEQMNLDEVAVLLGYSEQTSFGRAFKRWTGSTPQRYRSVQAG